MVTIGIKDNGAIEFSAVDPVVFEGALHSSAGGWVYMEGRDGEQIAVPVDQILYMINDDA